MLFDKDSEKWDFQIIRLSDVFRFSVPMPLGHRAAQNSFLCQRLMPFCIPLLVLYLSLGFLFWCLAVHIQILDDGLAVNVTWLLRLRDGNNAFVLRLVKNGSLLNIMTESAAPLLVEEDDILREELLVIRSQLYIIIQVLGKHRRSFYHKRLQFAANLHWYWDGIVL
jgi:hypothetical protein